MTTDKKIKILTISDHPLSASGVGIQTNNMITGLLDTGKYQVTSIGGAIKHQSYEPQQTEQYGEDWIIYPVDGYGTQDMVRSVIQNEKPDILWFMTDPRFFEWLWMIDNEVRQHVPMVYYHVWDNYPYPHFNKKFYDSNDVIVTISKVTDDIVRTVAPDVECIRLPHSVDPQYYRPLPSEEVQAFVQSSPILSFHQERDKVLFFWNNRNARRKQSGSLLWWFKEFLNEVGEDKAALLMHTDPKDPNGQDLEAMLHELDALDGQIMLSPVKVGNEDLAKIYNAVDCTINISDAEGFGLSTFESLMCGTPIIANMTGGLQEQVTDGEQVFGVAIEPAAKAIIGSQQVPYIYEDRINKKDFIDALKKVYNMTKEEREEAGTNGREYLMKNYGFENYQKRWDEIFTDIHNKYGSWDTRKNYTNWTLKEVV